MMKTKIRTTLVILTTLSVATAAAAADTISLGVFSSTDEGFEWAPGNSCSKPVRPRQMEEHSLNAYVDASRDYVDCIKNQAENDATYAVEAIYAGAQQATDDFIREVERGY